jgi:hypothetical protein
MDTFTVASGEHLRNRQNADPRSRGLLISSLPVGSFNEFGVLGLDAASDEGDQVGDASRVIQGRALARH